MEAEEERFEAFAADRSLSRRLNRAISWWSPRIGSEREGSARARVMVQLLYDCCSHGARRVRTHTVIPNANGIPRAPFSRTSRIPRYFARAFPTRFVTHAGGYASICHSRRLQRDLVTSWQLVDYSVLRNNLNIRWTRNNLNIRAGGISL